jgi:hypothetical protein
MSGVISQLGLSGALAATHATWLDRESVYDWVSHLAKLDTSSLFGFSYSTARRFESKGLLTSGDMRRRSKEPKGAARPIGGYKSKAHINTRSASSCTSSTPYRAARASSRLVVSFPPIPNSYPATSCPRYFPVVANRRVRLGSQDMPQEDIGRVGTGCRVSLEQMSS